MIDNCLQRSCSLMEERPSPKGKILVRFQAGTPSSLEDFVAFVNRFAIHSAYFVLAPLVRMEIFELILRACLATLDNPYSLSTTPCSRF